MIRSLLHFCRNRLPRNKKCGNLPWRAGFRQLERSHRRTGNADLHLQCGRFPITSQRSVLEFSSKVVRIDSPITMRVDSLSTPQKIVQVKATVPRRGLAMVNAIGVQPSQSTTFAAKSRASAVPVESLHRIAPQLKPPNGAAYPDMYFKSSGVNPFLDTEDEHLSTFAMDVDTASYSITRRYLTEGHLPPSEAVRVEEFVNAFKYDYAAPIDDAFAIHLEGAPSIFADSKRTHLLRIGLKGRVIPDEDRKDAALTFVIDVSGSMERENRLGLVKKALTLLVDQLRPTDKVGIVVYGSQGRLVLPHTGVNRRAEILSCHRFPVSGRIDQRRRRVAHRLRPRLAQRRGRSHQSCDSLLGWCCQCGTNGSG